MTRHSIRQRRSGYEWSVRATLALIAATVGYISVERTVASTLRIGNPAKAYDLAPNDGRIIAQYAQSKAGVDANAADRREADELARKALKLDPTAVAAVSVLGLNAQVRGNVTQARRLMHYAQALSRRDLQVQVWAIEDSVARADVPSTLLHYDIALRTSRTASDLLFPILGAAIADPAIRSSLTKTMAAKPAWANSFVDYITTRNSDPKATAGLLRSLDQTSLTLPEGARAAAIGGLLAEGQTNDAWSYYASIRHGVDRRASRDPHFKTSPAAALPFDWVPVNEAGIVTAIEQNDRGGFFDFSAPSSVGGALLRQVQLLPPGRYRLTGRSSNIDAPADARPYWQLACQGGPELGRVDVPASPDRNATFRGTFNVPENCPLQTLSLIARPVDKVAGLSGQINYIELAMQP